MNEAKMEQTGTVRKITFDFEKSTICIARRKAEDTGDNAILRYILADILHLDEQAVVDSIEQMEENSKRILVGRYIRDVAKTFVYTITCYLNSIGDDNYVTYIKDEEEEN